MSLADLAHRLLARVLDLPTAADYAAASPGAEYVPEQPTCQDCVTPADVGLPEYSAPDLVVHSHPDCPVHGKDARS